MGALVATINKKGENSVPTAVKMLRELMHRGTDSHGIATPNSVKTAGSIETIATQDINSNIVLGHNLSIFCLRDKPQPVLGKGFAVVFEGRLFLHPCLSEVDKVVELLEVSPYRKSRRIIEQFDGAYTFAIARADMLIAGRDTLGISPLYYGENDTTFALASERKALWAIGAKNANSFPPGSIAVVNKRGSSFIPVKTVIQPSLRAVDTETAAEQTKNLLRVSIEKRVFDLDKVAVAFSGGLDSSIIAVLAKNCGVEVHLFSVGLKNQREVTFAETAARALGLPLDLHTYTIDDVKSILPKVLWLIEEPNMMKVSVATPLYWVAENSSKLGLKVLLTGLGGDELFGGYQKYLREYRRNGVTAVRNAIYHDVEKSCEINFQRDNKVCSFHKVELRLPFTDQNVVNFALGLPVNLNINFAEDKLRKRVLRQTAYKLGIPYYIVNKAKRAIQYATGVSKAVQKLAKEEGLSLEDYVRENFKKAYPEAKV